MSTPVKLLGILCFFCCAVGLGRAVDKADDALARAASAVEHGQFAEAESGLRVFLREHPGNVRASGLLGAALDGQQKLGEAETLYREALRRTPDSVLLLDNYGNHLLRQGDAEGARLEFEKACSIDPSDQNAHLQLARLAIDRHEGAAALEFLSRLPDLRAPALQLLRAEALYWAGRKDESFGVIAALENTYDADPRVHSSAGLALSRMGQFARSEKAFSRALAKAPGDPDVLYNLGLAAVGAGHDQRAEVDFQTLLRQQPDNVDVLLELGRLRGRAGDGEGAIALLTKAARLAPKRADVQRALALALAR
jgi:Flp pilus assembly protein TadD